MTDEELAGFGPAETVGVGDVNAGDLLYAPEAYPAGLWGVVAAVGPGPAPGYRRLDLIRVGLRRHVELKAAGAVRVRRPLVTAPDLGGEAGGA